MSDELAYDPRLRISALASGDYQGRVDLVWQTAGNTQHASLAPGAARALARQLSRAADKAEGRHLETRGELHDALAAKPVDAD